MNTGIEMPLWFSEGLAEYLSTGWNSEADMFLMDRAIHGEIAPPGPELNGYMAYKGGQSFLYYLASSRGDSLFTLFLRDFRDTRRLDPALKKRYGRNLEELGLEWKQELKRIYWPEIGRRELPEKKATAISTTIKPKTMYNLKPRISPDGTRIAFFSDTRDYTQILVTDPSGKVLSRIKQRGYGGYFESFHPFRSGLCWSPDGGRLAFVTKSGGRDEIRIVDAGTGRLVDKVSFDSLQTLSSPDWSPDSVHLVFTGIIADRSDLFLYSLTDQSLLRLTADITAESDPRFTRDGRAVVYTVEDTCGIFVDLKANREHEPATDLCMMTLADRSVKRLTDTPWNEKQPAPSPDGSRIMFVSDRNGIDNLYIGRPDSLSDAAAVTDFIGMCQDPDWARDTSLAAFCLFQKGTWHIHTLADPERKLCTHQPAPTNWVSHLGDSTTVFFTPAAVPDSVLKAAAGAPHAGDSSDTAATRPSPDSTRGEAAEDPEVVIGAAPDAETELPTEKNGTAPGPDPVALSDTVDSIIIGDVPRHSFPYRLKFSPDLVTLGMGVSSVYGYAGQWLIALSDLMGDHRITLAGDIQGRLDEYVHVFGAYMNSRYRTDFGVGGFYSRDYTIASTGWDSLYHDTQAGGIGMVSYPFSINSRADFNFYYSHVERTSLRYDTTSYIDDRTRFFNIVIPTLSWVFDNILWGITGPVNGIRSRTALTVIPPISTIDASFVSLDVDVRKYYHFAKRFVLANKIAVGGSLPLNDGPGRRYFLGGSENWLFYPDNDIARKNYEDNLQNMFYSDMIVPFRGWHYFELAGSRYAVVNTEFRFPFIREVSVVWPLPLTVRYINGALFADAGNVWDREDQQEHLPLPRDLFGGIGFGLRVNLDIFVLRYDRAWKTDWHSYIKSPVTYFSLGADF